MKLHDFPVHRGARGFTLMELLVVMAILGILAGIATPTYLAHVRKTRRTEARTALLDLAARQERLFSTTNAYSARPVDLGYGADSATFPMPVGNGYYLVAVDVPTDVPLPTFTLTATPVPGMGQEEDFPCASFSVTHTGKQSAASKFGADTSASCWN